MNNKYLLEYSSFIEYAFAMPAKITNPDQIRSAILDAAQVRFQHFGVNKTTMAEIATDLDMSAANLYRYYQNKQDIAAACAERCMLEEFAQLRQSVKNSHQSAAAMLRAYIAETLRIHTNTQQEHPRIHEMVTTLTNQRQDIAHQKIQRNCNLLAEILRTGNTTGEFDIREIEQTAKTVYAALVLFDVPIFSNLFDDDEFNKLAESVTQLLLRGLEKR